MNSINKSNETSSTVFDQRLRLVEHILLTSMFVFALLLNTFVLIMMYKNRHKRLTRMAFFILHLTIADLLVAIFSIFPLMVWKLTGVFLGGDFLCRTVTYFMVIPSYISVYTLVAMAKDLYQAIAHPLSTYAWTYHSGLIHMGRVWCLSLLLASPQLFIFRFSHDENVGNSTCTAHLFSMYRKLEIVYILWTIVLRFLIPMSIIIFCYASVYMIINKSYSIYHSSDNSKTISIARLTNIRITRRLNKVPSSTTRPNNHIHTKCPPASNSSLTSLTFINRPKSETVNDMKYPVIFRLRRSPTELTKHQSTISINEVKSRKNYDSKHFLSRARLKTIKFTLVVVITYIICSTPFYFGLIIPRVSKLNEQFPQAMNWFSTIFSLLFNLNSCSNPIICLTLSGAFFHHRSNSVRQASSLIRKNQMKCYKKAQQSI